MHQNSSSQIPERLGVRPDMARRSYWKGASYTLEDDSMDPENHWLVEENTLPAGQTVRVHVSFRECIGKMDLTDRRFLNHVLTMILVRQSVLRVRTRLVKPRSRASLANLSFWSSLTAPCCGNNESTPRPWFSSEADFTGGCLWFQKPHPLDI